MSEILGYTEEEMMGMSFRLYTDKENSEKIFRDFNEVYRTGIPSKVDYEQIKKDGSKMFVETSVALMRDSLGQPTGFRGIVRDITGRRQTEETLRESEERYRNMIENSSDLIQSVTPEGKFIFVNPAWRESLGYTEEELLDLSLFQIIHTDSMAHCQRMFQEIMSGHSVKNTQATFVSKSGRLVIVEGNVVPRMVGTQVIATHGFFRDITERKRAENELQRNYDTQDALNFLLRRSLENIPLEEMLKQALDLVLSIPWLAIESKGGIFLVEDDPEILVMKAQNNLEEPVRIMCARVPFGKCLCGRAASMQKIQFSDRLDERHEIVYEGMRPHGHYCAPILFAGRTIGVINLYVRKGHHQDQKEEAFLTAITDMLAGIIERKRAEEALQEGQRQQKALLDNIPDIAWLKDKENRFIATNEPFGKACGFEPDDLVGKTDLDIWPRALAERYIADDKEVMESGKRKQVEEPLTDSEGKSLWIETIKTPIYDEQGNVVGTAGIARDITERKQAEAKLQNTLVSLRKAFNTTIQVMVSAVETRDAYTAGHQTRSADLARAIATEMGLPQEKIEGIRMAGSIHDIGKLSIPAEILSKPTKLSEIEFSLIKEHARKGFEMLKDVESPWPLAEIVYQHHERMDGSGYPQRLKGDDILMEARILAVADVVEAMASHRPYRPGLGIETALNEIEKNRGIFYDNAVADACLRLFREKGYKLSEAWL
ncbi:MAG: PAS domain S-box protein [Syntrophales bacterium]|nr:PAS domain S-box protein [Syntrophales bacterium]